MLRNFLRALSIITATVFLMIVMPFSTAFAQGKTVYVHSNTVKVYKNGVLLPNSWAQ